MFSKLWYLATLQWWKLELPSTDPTVLADSYSMLMVCPSMFKGDFKQTLKFYNQLSGFRSRNVPSRKKLEKVIPDRFKPRTIRVANVDAFRENRKFHIAQLKRGESVYLFVEDSKLHKLESRSKDATLIRNSILVYRVLDISPRLREHILRKNLLDIKDKLDKLVPKECGHCGQDFYTLSSDGRCYCCGSSIGVLDRYLIKRVGKKIVHNDASNSDLYKELSKSKYKDYLETQEQASYSIFVRIDDEDDEDDDEDDY